MPPTRRVAPETPLHELEYAVVDVETTGHAHDGIDRVTEVAAVLVRQGRIAGQYATLVNPRRPIPVAVQRLTGITNAMVAGAPEFADIADDLAAELSGRVFVAHNVAFDWGFVSAEFARARGDELAGERLCTVRLARRLLSHLPRRNLDALSAHYGIANRARHRAFGDAEATAEVFARMLDQLGRDGVHTWRDLRALLAGRKRRRRSALPQPVFDFRIA